MHYTIYNIRYTFIFKIKFKDEDIESTVSIRLYIEKFLNSRYGKLIELISSMLSLFSTVLYISSTYSGNEITAESTNINAFKQDFLWF